MRSVFRSALLVTMVVTLLLGLTAVSPTIKADSYTPPAYAHQEPLYAGQTIPIGQVLVWNDTTNLYVQVRITQSCWTMSKSDLHVATSLSGFPRTKTGNPIPGQFDYHREYTPWSTEDTYVIPLSWDVGATLYIALHANVQCADRSESAWAGTTRFTSKGSWGTYFTYVVIEPEQPVSCGCTYTIGYWKNHEGHLARLLPVTLGNLEISSVSDAQNVLSYLGDASNGINKLMGQLLAAKLNIKNGACGEAVADVIEQADAFLRVYGPADWSSLSRDQKSTVLEWFDTLDAYNNGLIGPGHCD